MLTSKERIQRIIRREPVDRIGLFEVFWGETARRWVAQGHFEKPEMASDHFGLEIRRAGGQITPMSWKLIDLFANPGPSDEIVEETDTDKLVRNGNGALLRWRKSGSGAPNTSIFSSKSARVGKSIFGRASSIRTTIRGASTLRIIAKPARNAPDKNLFFTAGVGGAFDLMNELCGHEHVLVGMALDPDWVRDMVNVYSRVAIDLLEMLFEQAGLPDGLWVWDDLGFKHRPFMSPAMYRDLIFPAHKRLFDFAHSRGLPVILHSDGLTEPLIPDLIEAGIDCLQPLEVKAGMDPVKIKKLYGDRLALDRRNGRPRHAFERSRLGSKGVGRQGAGAHGRQRVHPSGRSQRAGWRELRNVQVFR